jgi:hypothetical protein
MIITINVAARMDPSPIKVTTVSPIESPRLWISTSLTPREENDISCVLKAGSEEEDLDPTTMDVPLMI